MNKSRVLAEALVDKAHLYGWNVAVRRNTILEITKRISGLDEFTTADMEYGSILDSVPSGCGSTWGTDGGGIGGMTALNTGLFVMKKSGVRKLILKELIKMGH